MPIPQLTDTGLLPPGVHSCDLLEARTMFAWNERRAALFTGLETFLAKEIYPLYPDPIVLDGSYVTDKVLPSDTDVVLDCTAAPDDRKWRALQLMKRRNDFKAIYSVDFWINLPDTNDFVAFFQYTGVKTAKLKGLHPSTAKGILRVSR
jgi:hypothetical protein